MTKSRILKEDRSPFAKGIIQSLCFLYQELQKENLQELASLIETTIDDCERALRERFPICSESEDTLRQFYLLRGFKQLDKEQKELFIRAIDGANNPT